MHALIDTSSLVAFVKYYLPFDKDGKLEKILETMVLNQSIRVIDKVVDECMRVSKGIVMNSLPFLEDKKYQTKTIDIVPDGCFHNLVDNNFVVRREKNKLEEAEYQNVRERFLKSADCALVLYAYTHKNEFLIISEETGVSNDGKVFGKIPNNCQQIGVIAQTLPVFLKDKGLIDISPQEIPLLNSSIFLP